MPNKTLSAIIVNYNSEGHLAGCILSVQEKIGNLAEIIVVNNDSKDITPLLSSFSGVKMLSRDNLGFGAGANAGFRQAAGDILLFLNPDARLVSHELDLVMKEFKADDQLAVISPRLHKKGKIEPWTAGKEVSLVGLIRNNLNFSKNPACWMKSEKLLTDWVSGTAMFVRRDVFAELGGFDEKFFMYFEDMDLCKRARLMGKKVMFLPEYCVEHMGGESYLTPGAQKKDYYDSLEYYFKKHRSFLERIIIKAMRKIFF